MIKNKTELETLEQSFCEHRDIDSRRRLGQFFTPTDLANEIVKYGLTLLKSNEIVYLEPAIGVGAFYNSLLEIAQNSSIKATGIEIDKELFDSAKELWANSGIKLINGDFTELQVVGEQVNLLITNPPYVRHHFISPDKKKLLKEKVFNETHLKVSGLAGLYCYFMLLSKKWLTNGAVSGWLIPSEFMDVNYGKSIKTFLLEHVKLLRIHRYDPSDSLFNDAMVSSCVVWFANKVEDGDYEIEFTYGGTHEKPRIRKFLRKTELLKEEKWTRFPEKNVRDTQSGRRLKDYFYIKRGLATGDNDFFIMSRQQINEHNLDFEYFRPILPSPRNLKTDEIVADNNNNPMISPQLFLLNCPLEEDIIKSRYPSLWQYLLSGIGNTSEKYLCKNRKKWYMQEQREPATFLCSYMGRSSSNAEKPFRFILNHSDAVATNTYLMLYPKKDIEHLMAERPEIKQDIWSCLNSITAEDFESEGRVYGGGLRKIEPKELGNVCCTKLDNLINNLC